MSYEFQQQISNDLHKLSKTKEVVIAVDKTRNLYKIKKPEYKRLLLENITKEYMKSSNKDVNKVNSKSAVIAKKLQLEERMECFTSPDVYVTIKDHKENFPARTTCRLINPAKTDIDRVSKQLLLWIAEEVRQKINVNQWRSTNVVIDWFKNFKSKNKLKFLKFDIVNFYTSISKQLLTKAIEFAGKHFPISKDIIMHPRESFLFLDNEPWFKGKFDVPMGRGIH